MSCVLFVITQHEILMERCLPYDGYYLKYVYIYIAYTIIRSPRNLLYIVNTVLVSNALLYCVHVPSIYA